MLLAMWTRGRLISSDRHSELKRPRIHFCVELCLSLFSINRTCLHRGRCCSIPQLSETVEIMRRSHRTLSSDPVAARVTSHLGRQRLLRLAMRRRPHFSLTSPLLLHSLSDVMRSAAAHRCLRSRRHGWVYPQCPLFHRHSRQRYLRSH